MATSATATAKVRAAAQAGQAGHFVWALDVARFLPREAFLARMDAQIDQLKASARKPGADEIRIPGERGQRRKRELLARNRLPLAAGTWRMLEACAAQASVPLPPSRTVEPGG